MTTSDKVIDLCGLIGPEAQKRSRRHALRAAQQHPENRVVVDAITRAPAIIPEEASSADLRDATAELLRIVRGEAEESVKRIQKLIDDLNKAERLYRMAADVSRIKKL